MMTDRSWCLDGLGEPTPDGAHRITLLESWDKESAVLLTRDLAAAAGFNRGEQVLLAAVASELSTNILRYAGRGELVLRALREGERVGIEIQAIDAGPGIPDVELALQDHYSTEKGSLGLGLPSVKRIMDEFKIDSRPGCGTRVLARRWVQHGQR